jgi:hypothetical protein
MKFGCYLFGHSYKSNEGISYFKYSCVRCEHQSNYPGMEKWENTFWDSEYWGAIKIIFWIIFGILVFFSFVIGLVSVISSNTCQEYSKMGIDVVWNFWTGCMANHPKFGYIPIAEYFRTLNINLP